MNPDNKPMTAEEIDKARQCFKEVIAELGFANHKPSEMSNSDYWMCTSNAMIRYAEKAIAYEQWKAGVFAEWIDSIHPLTPHDVNSWRHMTGLKKSKTTTELYNCEEFKEYLENRRKEEGR